MVKNLPVMQEMKETLVQAVDWEDSLDEEMATHSSILAWKIPWTEEPVGLSSLGLQSWTRLSMHTHLKFITRGFSVFTISCPTWIMDVCLSFQFLVICKYSVICKYLVKCKY